MMGGPAPLPPPFMMALRAAVLTSDQQTKLRSILDSSRSETDPAMEQLHALHEQIANKLLGPGAVTEAEVAPMLLQAGQLDQQIQKQSLSTALKIRAILTPAQLERMNKFNQQMSQIHEQIEKLMHGPTPLPGGSAPHQ